jgi:Protein kinase domain
MEPLSADDPRQIGEFSLRARLGAGGMGRVYLAFSPGGRAVAMKVVHPGLANDPEFLRRFRNEVAAARAVSGMYTAPVVSAGVDDNPPWLATAYVPGPPLAEVVSRYGPLPETAIWRLAAGLTEALSVVHSCGLVHRDLKPGNVLLAADGPHVIDFGISRAFEGTSVTSTGMVVGTPGYMSPEQAEGQQAGPPSDVFSLGCVLAYAATGNAPFGGGSAAGVLYRVVTAEPDLSEIPANLRQVLAACLAKNPAQRIGLAQLGPMIAALGPPMPGMLGAFWPEPLANVIAADQPHTVTQLSAPPVSAPPVSAPPVSAAPVSAPPVSAPPVSAAPVSAAPVSPAQGGWTAQVQQPMAGQPGPMPQAPMPGVAGAQGVTGHAPMVADGYYSAAAYNMGAGNQAAAGPMSPGPAPAQPQYGQPPVGQPQYGQPSVGQPSVGQAWSPPYQADQQQAPWQQPNAAPPQPNTPGSPYEAQYGAPSWPQQAGQGPSGPSGPWSQQQPAYGGSWPGSGQLSGPSGPRFPSPATPLAQYTPARQRPPKSEIPPPVLSAVRLMYLGAAITLLDVILGALAAAVHEAYWVKYQNAVRPSVRVAAQHAQTAAGLLDLTVVVGGAVGIVCWLVVATACRRGRSWTRIASTVLLTLDAACLVTDLVNIHSDLGVNAISLIVWIIGVAATVPLWGRQASNFFAAWRTR